jgi:hypothetical protein
MSVGAPEGVRDRAMSTTTNEKNNRDDLHQVLDERRGPASPPELMS